MEAKTLCALLNTVGVGPTSAVAVVGGVTESFLREVFAANAKRVTAIIVRQSLERAAGAGRTAFQAGDVQSAVMTADIVLIQYMLAPHADVLSQAVQGARVGAMIVLIGHTPHFALAQRVLGSNEEHRVTALPPWYAYNGLKVAQAGADCGCSRR